MNPDTPQTNPPQAPVPQPQQPQQPPVLQAPQAEAKQLEVVDHPTQVSDTSADESKDGSLKVTPSALPALGLGLIIALLLVALAAYALTRP